MSEESNDSQTTVQPPAQPRGFWPGRPTEWIIAGALVTGMFLFFCIPLGDFGSRRHPSKCRGNLRMITLALLNYENSHHSLPPAFLADAQGKPMHSWRVLILPYLSQQGQEIYSQYRFDEPWDGPNNSKLAQRCPDLFRCPEDVKRYGRPNEWMTSYVAVVGPETVWPGEQSTKIRDITDGTTTTLLVVEVADSGINWMEPRDLHLAEMEITINSHSGKGISSEHKGGARVAFADGSVRSLEDSLSAETVRALLTRNGGETIDDF